MHWRWKSWQTCDFAIGDMRDPLRNVGDRREIPRTTCRKCGAEDGFEHLLSCAGLEVPERTGGPAPTIECLVELARSAYRINPGRPDPRRPPAEIELDLDPPSGGETELAELSFDGPLSQT